MKIQRPFPFVKRPISNCVLEDPHEFSELPRSITWSPAKVYPATRHAICIISSLALEADWENCGRLIKTFTWNKNSDCSLIYVFVDIWGASLGA